MAEFTISGYDYISEKMSAFEQDRIVRRLTPILPLFIEYNKLVADEVRKTEAESDVNFMERLVASENGKAFVAKAADTLSSIDDEKAEFVYALCLSKCKRRPAGENGTWMPVWNTSANRLQPNALDINYGVMLKITLEVVKSELSNFF